MNQIEKKFKNLLLEINSQSAEELFGEMKKQYFLVPLETRVSMENFFHQFPYWGNLDSSLEDFTEILNASNVLKENTSNFLEFFENLEDYRSKYLLYAILHNWYCYDFVSLQKVIENTFSHYLDLDILPSLHDEVFVDLGAYTGDTVFSFFDTLGADSFSKVYAYEMSLDSVNILNSKLQNYSNIVVRQCAVSNFVGKGSILENNESASANVLTSGEDILITTLDEDIKEKITLLKMDIEGSEKNALYGAKRHIIEDKPKLMISVYHGFSDLLDIWNLLREWNPDYKFYLRYYGGPIFPTEIVLYAV